MKKSLSYFLIVLIVVLAGTALALFLKQNSDPAVLYFGAEWMGFYRTRELALGNIVLLAFLSGVLLSGVVLTSNIVLKSLELRRLRRELEAIQRTLEIKTRK